MSLMLASVYSIAEILALSSIDGWKIESYLSIDKFLCFIFAAVIGCLIWGEVDISTLIISLPTKFHGLLNIKLDIKGQTSHLSYKAVMNCNYYKLGSFLDATGRHEQ